MRRHFGRVIRSGNAGPLPKHRLDRSAVHDKPALRLAGALSGQVHLSGWFLAAGFVIGSAVAEWRGRRPRVRTWLWWLISSFLGLISAIPWTLALPKLPFSVPVASDGTGIKDRSRVPVWGWRCIDRRASLQRPKTGF
jgi:hypothetical protein